MKYWNKNASTHYWLKKYSPDFKTLNVVILSNLGEN
jgi:hypothetical protein